MEFPATFNNQDEFDAAIQKRLTRERQKWESERGGEGLEAAQSRVAELEADIRTRDARAVLQSMNVTDQGRQDKIMRLIDWPEVADDKSLREAFKAAYDDTPEMFGSDAQVKDKGLDTSGSDGSEGPLTRERVESMSPSEINSNWDRVKAFLSGERN